MAHPSGPFVSPSCLEVASFATCNTLLTANRGRIAFRFA